MKGPARAAPARARTDAPTTPLERRDRIRERLAAEGAAALLVTSMPNVRYLSGFTGSAGALLVFAGGADLLITDGRYDRQAREEAGADVEVEIVGEPALEVARERLSGRGAVPVAFEADHLVVSAWRAWSEADGPALEPATGWVEGLRVVKSAAEVEAIRRAARAADAAFDAILEWIAPGVTERETAARLDLLLAEAGAEGRAFETIAAFGERSALPHARPGARRLAEGDVVLLDFGAVVDGYCSDMTRTVACGDPGRAMEAVYDVVLAARDAAVEGLSVGMTGREADALARDVIDAAGHGEAFPHSLGHGIGLVVHEEPRLSKRSDAVLPAGATVTVEPGVYLAGVGGVRIEDDVVLGEGGVEVLTESPREVFLRIG